MKESCVLIETGVNLCFTRTNPVLCYQCTYTYA